MIKRGEGEEQVGKLALVPHIPRHARNINIGSWEVGFELLDRSGNPIGRRGADDDPRSSIDVCCSCCEANAMMCQRVRSSDVKSYPVVPPMTKIFLPFSLSEYLPILNTGLTVPSPRRKRLCRTR